jgi:hypothetical protein
MPWKGARGRVDVPPTMGSGSYIQLKLDQSVEFRAGQDRAHWDSSGIRDSFSLEELLDLLGQADHGGPLTSYGNHR